MKLSRSMQGLSALALLIGLVAPADSTACIFCKMAALKNAPTMRQASNNNTGAKYSGGATSNGSGAKNQALTDPNDYFKDTKQEEVVDKTRGTNRTPGASNITEVRAFEE